MIDSEHGPNVFSAHSDQGSILEESLYKFVRFDLDAVFSLVARK